MDGGKNDGKACYVTETVTREFSSLSTLRETTTKTTVTTTTRTRSTERTVEVVYKATERKPSPLAEGGRDYRSWAGKPRINRWRVALPNQWRVPAVDHPFHAILYRCNPVESRPNSPFSCRKNRLYTHTHTGTRPISLQERNLLIEERTNFFLYFFFFSLSIHSVESFNRPSERFERCRKRFIKIR